MVKLGRVSGKGPAFERFQPFFCYVEVEDDLEKAAQEGWETAEQAYKAMESEVEEYDHYLTGQCYGYVVEDADGEEIDSCWGFLGDSDYVRGEMRAAAMSAVEAANKEVAEAAYWPSGA